MTNSTNSISTWKPNSSHVKAALRMHYAAPEYAILEEVRNATGRLKKRQGKQPRYCDMLAMSLWPSLGLEIMGFEIKVTRADWLNEIKDSKKAVAVGQFCDRWYLVVPDAKIVKEGELPAGWGMIVADGFSVREVVAAPKRDALPITREFLASLMRNATTANPDHTEVALQIKMGIEANRPVSARRNRDSVAGLEVKRLKQVIADYELANGVKIGGKKVPAEKPKAVAKVVTSKKRTKVAPASKPPARTKTKRIAPSLSSLMMTG